MHGISVSISRLYNIRILSSFLHYHSKYSLIFKDEKNQFGTR